MAESSAKCNAFRRKVTRLRGKRTTNPEEIEETYNNYKQTRKEYTSLREKAGANCAVTLRKILEAKASK